MTLGRLMGLASPPRAPGQGGGGEGRSFSRFRDALKRGLNLTVVRNAAIITSPPVQ